MKRKIFSGTMAGVFAACIILSAPVMAQTIHEELTRTPGRTLSAAEESAISSAAVHTLRQIVKARGEIHDKDIEQAKKDLGQAMVLIQIIKSSLPTIKVKDHIWVAKKHLDYETTEQVLPDLIPINEDLTEIEDIVPVDEAKNHIAKARKALQKGDKKSAKKNLNAADKLIVFDEIDLPLASTEKHIIAAETMLSRDKSHDADMELKSAEDSVQFASVALQAPLTKAKRSLWHAFKDYAAGKKAETSVDLKKAETYLKKVGENTDKRTKAETDKLYQDTKSLKDKLKNGGKHTTAEFKGLWERSKALSERGAASISTGWQKIHSKGIVKTDLLEAKLHVEYAEIYQLTTRENKKADIEIATADSFLKNAAKNADSRVKTKIDAVVEKVSQVRTDLNGRKDVVKDRYEKIKTDMVRLIHDL